MVFARVLRIVPNNATCTMTDDSTAATATSTPIPGGYVWNIVEPPPSVLSDGVTLASVHVFCTAAAVVSVSQGN